MPETQKPPAPMGAATGHTHSDPSGAVGCWFYYDTYKLNVTMRVSPPELAPGWYGMIVDATIRKWLATVNALLTGQETLSEAYRTRLIEIEWDTAAPNGLPAHDKSICTVWGEVSYGRKFTLTVTEDTDCDVLLDATRQYLDTLDETSARLAKLKSRQTTGE